MLHNWSENDIDVNGVTIHYRRTGHGDKPPVVLLHGWSDNGLCWLPVAAELETDYDLILPDAIGHGKSQRVQEGQQIDLAADAAGLIQALGLDRPVLGGHSMGGSTAGRTAARFPGLVRGLILEDPAWFDAPPPPPEPKEGDKPQRPARRNDMEEMSKMSIEALMEHCRKENPGWPEVELRPWALSKKEFDTKFATIHDNRERDWPEVVDYIDVPTLLLTAGPDKWAIITPQTSARLEAQYSNIHVAYIPNAGHSIRRDNFSDYMRAVRSFLKEIY